MGLTIIWVELSAMIKMKLDLYKLCPRARQFSKAFSLAGCRMATHEELKISGHSAPCEEVSIPVPWGYIKGCSWGNPEGLPVLALHGWLDNAGTFSKLAPLLSKDLYIVAIDFPGHGQSSHKPPGCRYSFQDGLTFVKRVVDALGWKTFMFLSHSLGAGISSWFAAALPDLVKAMVLIEFIGAVTISVEEDIPILTGAALSAPETPKDTKIYPTWNDAVKRLLEGHHIFDHNLTLEAAEALCVRGTVRTEGGYQFSRDLRLKEQPLLYIPDAINDAFLRNISCPSLVIMADPNAVYHRIDCLSKDKIKLVQVPGGHHLHLYKPEVLAPLVDSFLLTQTIPSGFTEISRL